MLFSANFPHSQPPAETAVNKVRRKRAESGPIPEGWEIEDYLTALQARVQPLKRLGVDMLDAAVHTFGALWPKVERPTRVEELAEYLLNSGERLDEWRESAARAGADEALAFTLSWYEGINLDALQTMRTGSKWIEDPELIKQRQRRAYSFVQYADIHNFVEAPEDLDGGEEDDEEEDEEVDEEIEAETNPEVTDPSSSNPAPGPAA